MKFKLSNVLVTVAIVLLFIASSTAVIRYILDNRKTASTQLVKVATYDPTPGRYARHTRLEFSSVPERLRAGELSIWSVKIVDRKEKDRHGQPKYVRSFVQESGNIINLVVVSDDLSYFKRFAADYKDYGHFLLQTSLPVAGTYRLYADYIPYGGHREVGQQVIEVADSPSAPIITPAVQASSSKEIGAATQGTSIQSTSTQRTSTQRVNVQADAGQGSGAVYQVELQTLPVASPPATKRKMQLHFRVSDAAGNEVTELEPYFGARAQCVAISRDGGTYLHPAFKEPVPGNHGILFETQFPQAGTYKVWLQFQQRNAVVTAPFTITVADGIAANRAAANRATKKG
ncbi:MAG TPA: hypothetical protein VF600_00730 [Abditibacteriaceae bacterium]|jgi:hypothetical protein